VAQTIGEWLQQVRQRRRLSQHALARQARLAPSTINRWERGITRPSIHELEQVLHALSVSSAERLEALRLLDAPRALMTLQQLTRQQPHPSGELNPPLLGDLLGALRRRHGWSVAQVAAALQVSERSVRGWERSQTIPSDEHLHALCYVLKATPDEVAFILTRPFWLEPPSTPTVHEEAALLKMRIEEMRQLIWQGVTEGMELGLFALEAQVWWHVRQCPHHAELLREVYTLCCQWYTLHGRVQDAERYGYRGLRLLNRERRFPRNAAWLIRAISIGHADPNRSESRLIESAGILQDWLPQVSQSIEYGAWFYREMSELRWCRPSRLRVNTRFSGHCRQSNASDRSMLTRGDCARRNGGVCHMRTLPHFVAQLTSTAEVEQHLQQVSIIDDAVTVGVGVGVAAAEAEQHRQ
jgi:transcriptional regulator with XRE-family HTH domain